MNTRFQNMFSGDVKCLCSRCQTLKFSCPKMRGNTPIGKMFSVKKGRNYRKNIPLSRDLQNQVKELVQNYYFAEFWQRYTSEL